MFSPVQLTPPASDDRTERFISTRFADVGSPLAAGRRTAAVGSQIRPAFGVPPSIGPAGRCPIEQPGEIDPAPSSPSVPAARSSSRPPAPSFLAPALDQLACGRTQRSHLTSVPARRPFPLNFASPRLLRPTPLRRRRPVTTERNGSGSMPQPSSARLSASWRANASHYRIGRIFPARRTAHRTCRRRPVTTNRIGSGHRPPPPSARLSASCRANAPARPDRAPRSSPPDRPPYRPFRPRWPDRSAGGRLVCPPLDPARVGRAHPAGPSIRPAPPNTHHQGMTPFPLHDAATISFPPHGRSHSRSCSRPVDPPHDRAVRRIASVHSGRSRPGVPVQPDRLRHLTAGDLELRPGWLVPPAPEVARAGQPVWTPPAVGRHVLATRPRLSAGGGVRSVRLRTGTRRGGWLRSAPAGRDRGAAGEASFDPESGLHGTRSCWVWLRFLTPPHGSARFRTTPHAPSPTSVTPARARFAPFRGNA